MTDYADPADVVLYDIEADPDDADALVALVADPERRWFARRRLATLAVKGMVAATWNPLLHPRGKDGKFIETGGWVRWFHWDGLFHRGRVLGIDEMDGTISVLPEKDSYYDGELPTSFPSSSARRLTAVEPPKAKLVLPDPKIADGDVLGWQKTGGKAGSNPGGKYEANNLHGKQGYLSALAWIGTTADLSGEPTSVEHFVFGRDKNDGRIYQRRDNIVRDHVGTVVHMEEEDLDNVDWVSGETDSDTEKAWREAVAVSLITVEGDEFYIKHGKSEDHVANEMLANRLYELAGVNVADTQVGHDPELLASRIVPFNEEKVDLLAKLDDPEILAKMREDFVVDAWLANWDVVGLDYENTQIVDGEPYRIDAGGALLYRAMGSPKGTMFGPEVGEFESFFNVSLNPRTAKVYGGITGQELKDGAERVAAVSPEKIKNLVEADDALPSSLADTIIARRAYILGKFGVEDPYENKYPESATEHAKTTPITPEELEQADQEFAEAAMQKPPPSPPPAAIADTEPKIHNLWNPGTKMWTSEPANVQNQIKAEVALKLLYTTTLTPTGGYTLTAILSASPYDEFYVLDNDGRLKTAKLLMPGYKDVVFTDVMDGSKTQREVGSWETLSMLPSDMAESTKQSLVNSYAFWMGSIRSERVSQDAYDPLSELFFTPDGAKHPVEPGFPEVPMFRSRSFTNFDQLGDGDLLYNKFDDELNRVKVDVDGSTISFISLRTGKPVPTNSLVMSDFLLPADDDHGYSSEVLDAIAQGVGVVPDTEGETSPGVDAATIAVLDNKAADLVDVIDQVPGGDLPGATVLTWFDAFEASQQAYYSSAAAQLPMGFLNAFYDEFGEKEPGKTITLDHLDKWMALKSIPVETAHTFLKDTKILDGPDTSGKPSDGSIAVPTNIAFVSPKLHVSHTYELASMSDEDRAVMRQLIVGKIIMVATPATLKTNDDHTVVQMEYPVNSYSASYGTPKPKAFLAYVEGVTDGQALKLRALDGAEVLFPKNQQDKGVVHVVDNISTQDLQLATPTLKANGDIAVSGQVVGKWEKEETYWGYGGWKKEYKFKYTVFAEHSITGKTMESMLFGQKGKMKGFASTVIIPPPAPVLKKKSASKGVKKIKAMVEAPLSPKGTYINGEEAKLGDWIGHTKGGGGFVGKIVGWPDQENHPGLVFAVSPDGIQKAANLATMKKVTDPGDTNPDQVWVGTVETHLPSAYTDLVLGDGQIPIVGQTVEAGKPGDAKVTGIIANINPAQGWVYIITPEGKKVPKTFSVTKVIEQPALQWDTDAVSIAATLDTTKAKYGPKTPGGPNYPGVDGLLVDQAPSVQAEWLDAHPKRKLTKDGYAPRLGMRVRTNSGDMAVITNINGPWASNPNGVTLWNLGEKKRQSTSVTTLEVDHGVETIGIDGKPVKTVGSVKLVGLSEWAADPVVPPGSAIYRYPTKSYYYKEGKYRYIDDWIYLIVPPDNGSLTINIYASSVGKADFWGTDLRDHLKNQAPESFEKVAIIDGTSSGQVKITPFYANSSVGAHHSTVEFEALEEETVTLVPDEPIPGYEPPTPEVPPAPTHEPEGPVVLPEPEPEPTPEPEAVVTLPVPEPGEPPPIDEEPEVNAIDPLEHPPAVVPSSSISSLIPPPQPPKPVVGGPPVYPAIPEIVAPEGVDLDQKPALLGDVRSLEEAAVAMLAVKDSKAAGTGSTYALGDADLVEDMAFRYNVEKLQGKEKLVLRFRLREDVSEDVIGKMLTSGSEKTGAWKLKGNVYPKQLQEGDPVAIRIASESKLLKPDRNATVPNARVVGKPVLIGKAMYTTKMASTAGSTLEDDIEVDVYRVKVRTENGDEGEVDMQHRPGASISVYEFDPDAPVPSSGQVLSLTPTAADAGWTHLGKMDIPGRKGQVLIDETGKVDFQGMMVGNMAKGQIGGYRMQRALPDGTLITFNAAHTTESGIGFDTTRRANIAGEIRILLDIDKEKPDAEMMRQISRAMQVVGLGPEAQNPPSDQQLVNYALGKFVTNYHPTYTYRDKDITGPNDPRVSQTLAHMTKHLENHLGRPVTLNDVRLHTNSSGRLQVVLSPEVAIAMGKNQGNHHFHHYGGSGRIVDLLAGTHNGLLGADERWSMGIHTSHLSAHTDLTVGSGDRIYMRASHGAGGGWGTGAIIFNPLAVNSSTEVYTKGVYDNYGRRNETNKQLTAGGNIEYMHKRKFEPEQFTFFIANNSSDRDNIISQLKSRGVTHIGSRPVEEVIVTASMIAKIPNFDTIGIDFYKDDIPITQLFPVGAEPAAAVAPAAAPAAAVA